MIYADTSAIVKLVVSEAETSALIAWLQQHDDENLVTSALTRVELMRTAVRDGSSGLMDRASRVLAGIDIIPITEAVIARAETIGPSTLRSLDAIHLASAAHIGEQLTGVLAYDRRLLEGCARLGYVTWSPAE